MCSFDPRSVKDGLAVAGALCILEGLSCISIIVLSLQRVSATDPFADSLLSIWGLVFVGGRKSWAAH